MPQLLESDGLWSLVEEIPRNPTLTAAISQQRSASANEMVGVLRDRSRTADDRLERLVRRTGTPSAARGIPGERGADVRIVIAGVPYSTRVRRGRRRGTWDG